MISGLKIKPMGIGRSILFFGVPSAFFTFCIYVLMQRFHTGGMSDVVNFYLTMVLPLTVLLAAALIAFKLEGNDLTWKSLAGRFRLRRMTGRDWLYTLALFLAMVVFQVALGFTAKWLTQFRLFAPPEFLIPAVDPRIPHQIVTDVFMGIPLKGQWWIAGLYFLALIFNIFGEEFWWRGYILPRQELALGSWTWVVHGSFWTLFHVFWKWNLLILLPVCLSLSYVVYKRKNTWIGIVTHMMFNSIPLVGLVIGIIG